MLFMTLQGSSASRFPVYRYASEMTKSPRIDRALFESVAMTSENRACRSETWFDNPLILARPP